MVVEVIARQVGEDCELNSNSIPKETFAAHLRKLEGGYLAQEERLESDEREFLTGGTFSTADIIWSIKVLRLVECGYPFEANFPALWAWYERVSSRPAFRETLQRNALFHRAFRLKSAVQRWAGIGITNDSGLQRPHPQST